MSLAVPIEQAPLPQLREMLAYFQARVSFFERADNHQLEYARTMVGYIEQLIKERE